MTFTCRDAALSDAAALDRIFKRSFCDTFAHLYRSEDLDAFLSGYSPAQWEQQIGDEGIQLRIAQVEGEPVGYLKLAPLKLPVEPCGPSILLDQLYILKEHHGTGIAHALMDWALAQSRGKGAVELYLTVYVDNHRARRFYDNYGFEPVGRYEFLVGSHADEDIIMRKFL